MMYGAKKYLRYLAKKKATQTCGLHELTSYFDKVKS